MDIEKIITEFVTAKSEGYEKDIRILMEFLESEKMPLVETTFQGIRTGYIEKSLDYYIDTRRLKSVSPAKRYVSAISEFFKYCILKGYIDNENLRKELFEPAFSDERSYIGIMNEKIYQDERLREKNTFDIIYKDEMVEIINLCNLTIDEYMYNEISKKTYNKILSALCIKLISFTGVTYRKIRQIKISDDIEQCNKICIDKFKLYLPENYSKQIKDYIKLRNEILIKENKETDYLFITLEGKQLSTNTSTISDFLGRVIGRGDLAGVVKYAIRNMILAGISDSIISMLTGAGPNLISCLLYTSLRINNR